VLYTGRIVTVRRRKLIGLLLRSSPAARLIGQAFSKIDHDDRQNDAAGEGIKRLCMSKSVELARRAPTLKKKPARPGRRRPSARGLKDFLNRKEFGLTRRPET